MEIKALLEEAKRHFDNAFSFPVNNELYVFKVRRLINAGCARLNRAIAELSHTPDTFESLEAAVSKWQDETFKQATVSSVLAHLEKEYATQAQILHQDKMMSLGRLAARVVHEINNPLSGILTPHIDLTRVIKLLAK